MSFFFNDTATTEIYTLSLHDALPILLVGASGLIGSAVAARLREDGHEIVGVGRGSARSEEHTSELQSRQYLVCRLLLEKKKSLYQNSYGTIHPQIQCRAMYVARSHPE